MTVSEMMYLFMDEDMQAVEVFDLEAGKRVIMGRYGDICNEEHNGVPISDLEIASIDNLICTLNYRITINV